MSNATRITALAQRIALRIKDLGTDWNGTVAPEAYFTSVVPRTDLTVGTEYRQPNANVHWVYKGGDPQVASSWTPWTYTYARQYDFQTMVNNRAADLSALTTSVKTNLVSALNEINAKFSDTGWGPLAADTGFTSNGFATRTMNGVVYLRGIINRDAGNYAVGTTYQVMTLPSDIRPAINMRYLIPLAATSSASVVVQTNGLILLNNIGTAANNAHFPEVAFPLA